MLQWSSSFLQLVGHYPFLCVALFILSSAALFSQSFMRSTDIVPLQDVNRLNIEAILSQTQRNRTVIQCYSVIFKCYIRCPLCRALWEPLKMCHDGYLYIQNNLTYCSGVKCPCIEMIALMIFKFFSLINYKLIASSIDARIWLSGHFWEPVKALI